MAKVHKVHLSKDSWKKDILLLTCILRLRVQPSVPYPEIANLFLRTMPARIACLARKAAPEELWSIFVQESMKQWLVGYLEVDFEATEFWESQTWLKARELNNAVVQEVLRVAMLDGRGYMLATEEEMRLQIQWRRDGDWKSGSVPERTPTMAKGVQQSIGDPAYHGKAHGPHAGLPKAHVLWEENRLTVGAQNSQRPSRANPVCKCFADQLEELRQVQNALSRDGRPKVLLTS